MYIAGLVPAVWVGAAIVAVGAVAALAIPRRLGILGSSSPEDEAEVALGGLFGAPEQLEPAYAGIDRK